MPKPITDCIPETLNKSFAELPPPTEDEAAEHAWAWSVLEEIDEIEREIKWRLKEGTTPTQTDMSTQVDEVRKLKARLKPLNAKLAAQDWRSTATGEGSEPAAVQTKKAAPEKPDWKAMTVELGRVINQYPQDLKVKL